MFKMLILFILLPIGSLTAQTTVNYNLSFHGDYKGDLNAVISELPGKFVFDEALKKITRSNSVETTVWKILSMKKNGTETIYYCETKWSTGVVTHPTITFDSFYLTLVEELVIDDFQAYSTYSVVKK